MQNELCSSYPQEPGQWDQNEPATQHSEYALSVWGKKSYSIYGTKVKIDLVIAKFPPIIEKLRGMSPYWKPAKQAA